MLLPIAAVAVSCISFVGYAADCVEYDIPVGDVGQTDDAVGPVPFNGLVVDADGNGIKVRVEVCGRRKVTVADKMGRFGLTDIKDTDTLILSYKGIRLTVPVGGRKSLKVLWMDGLNYTASQSDELVDLGFAYVKRREHTDSASGISGDELRKLGTSSLRDALLSRVPGLMMIDGEICIRGINSVELKKSALVLCDGHETNINSIDINQVESVEVLKGSNMYGFRGANGVILVKLKSRN